MSELTTAARPYARAVFELASESGSLAEWSEILSFMGAVAANDEVQAVLDNPTLTWQGKADTFIQLCDDKLDDKARNLARLLAENGRLELLPDIFMLFEGMKDKAEGAVEATVTSAGELSPEDQDRIASALAARLGREVKISTQTDESIMGGLIIRAGDMVIDGSIQGRLQHLARALNG